MNRALILAAALAFTASVSSAAPALDAAGKCRDNGKFVAAKLCAMPVQAGKCRDIKTKKFAKCSAPNTEPVPARK